MTDSYVRYELKDHVATLTMDRPPVNALDFQLMDDILAALRCAGNDPDVRAVVINSATEKAFCAGLDLKAVQDWSPSEVKRFLEKIYIELYDVQNALGKPSVAAVCGAARGGGISIAISCDMMVAGETSRRSTIWSTSTCPPSASRSSTALSRSARFIRAPWRSRRTG